jgi:hypothetical protein
MAPVTRVLEIYRPKFTEGQTGTMGSGNVDANVEKINTVTITGDGQVGTEFGV